MYTIGAKYKVYFGRVLGKISWSVCTDQVFSGQPNIWGVRQSKSYMAQKTLRDKHSSLFCIAINGTEDGFMPLTPEKIIAGHKHSSLLCVGVTNIQISFFNLPQLLMFLNIFLPYWVYRQISLGVLSKPLQPRLLFLARPEPNRVELLRSGSCTQTVDRL